MGLGYNFVIWSSQKKKYDRIILFFVLGYLVLYTLGFVLANPQGSVETLIIRATGSLALFMLTFILSIGPLSRLDRRLLPILYNRRHLGVSMFLVATLHGIFNVVHFHALGDINPFLSVFASNLDYVSFINFPFQVLGFFALIILFFMASTSHDFWLANLSPKVWKALHMMVYVAFLLAVMHVALGAFQNERSVFLIVWAILSVLTVTVLHLVAGAREKRKDGEQEPVEEGWVCAGQVEEIPEKRARVINIGGERVAVYKYDGKISAVSNVCKHQNGPLGEGKIVDGCITCPWHGYQYEPHNGSSPPPFTEKVATYKVKVVKGKAFVEAKAQKEGTAVKPAEISDEKNSDNEG
ncbi:hypothetical protein FUAX_22390 [Fulvitalea axinellae]|uniref:Rieske domain-containing protein n=1 Tax=Fulvitalea axinellae TaxID=1182444 RepID=A0AAU9CPB8_9BACT|nr:hypothetical protein FUAX_22390 [Fulvitalea axinellae]